MVGIVGLGVLAFTLSLRSLGMENGAAIAPNLWTEERLMWEEMPNCDVGG